ncbi:ATP-binding cassette domain-containing protein [Bartonella sp. DGB1]|uniref:ATP-binding cassette domain-containing protein n=1 Tax=Bartonella sp. DGB1 TaxID=3239807 RepID=UPI0035256D94
MKDLLKIFKKIWQKVTVSYKIFFYVTIILFILTSLSRVLLPILFSNIAEAALKPYNILLTAVLLYALVLALARILEAGRQFSYSSFQQEIQKKLYSYSLEKYYTLPDKEIKKFTSSESINFIDRGIGNIRLAMSQLLFNIVPPIIEGVMMILIIYYKVGILLAIQVFTILVIFCFFTYVFSIKIHSLEENLSIDYAKNYKILSEGVKTHESLRSFEKTPWLVSKLSDGWESFKLNVLNINKRWFILGVVQAFLLAFLFFTVNYHVILKSSSTAELVSLIVLINVLLMQLIVPLTTLSESYTSFVSSLAETKVLCNFIKVSENIFKLDHTFDKNVKGFKLQDIKVKLSSKNQLIYNDINISNKGITLISGASGQGKSTLTRVLAGLQPYEGKLTTGYLKNEILYLHQNVDIFDCSLFENIALGTCNEEKALVCLKKAGFSQKEIDNLLKNTLGENGNNISGGQAQRIGIARMLYHDAKVMIFDEPTNGLDSEAVEEIMSTFKKLAKDNNIIIVSHDDRIRDIASYEISLSSKMITL